MINLQPNLDLTTTEAERLIRAWSGSSATCSKVVRLEGGLVNSVFRLEFDRSPGCAVVKIHDRDGDTFADEARALTHLGTETACPVPQVYLTDSSGRFDPRAFLLLEHVTGECLQNVELTPAERVDVDVQLATVLRELHSHDHEHWGGLDDPVTTESWADRFATRLAEARDHPDVPGRLDPDVLEMVDESVDLARSALRDHGRPTLVHGDVWDGNLIVRREKGSRRIVALLDPKLEYADVEMELAYLEVFDNTREAFFAAYTDGEPLRPGYEQRRLFYWLHTALVHVALFGDDFFCEFTARTARQISDQRRAFT